MYVIKNIDLKGQKFERLLVLEAAGKDHRGNRLWKCLCDCGNFAEVITWRLRSKTTRSCGCIQLESARNINLSPPGEAACVQLFHQYRYEARQRKLVFELTKEQFRKLTSKNCFHCGRAPAQSKTSRNTNGSYIHNGIDRMNSNLGYTFENCVPCCKTCNFMKLDMTREAFIQACRSVVEHLEKQNGPSNLRNTKENAQEHVCRSFEA